MASNLKAKFEELAKEPPPTHERQEKDITQEIKTGKYKHTGNRCVVLSLIALFYDPNGFKFDLFSFNCGIQWRWSYRYYTLCSLHYCYCSIIYLGTS